MPACRACGATTVAILDLGRSPIANRLLATPDEQVETYPLGLVACPVCTLVQNAVSLPGEVLFDAGYPYFASISAAVRNHADAVADALVIRATGLRHCLEIGSNDGAVQLALARRGVRCVGVDPAAGPAERAHSLGCTTHVRPFDAATAKALSATEAPFAAATLSNVLAHVADPLALLSALRRCLAPGAFVMIEVQSWLALAESGAFDMVYHEHHSHFSLTSATALLGRAGYGVIGWETIAMQGGSLRLWCRPGEVHAPNVLGAIAAEARRLDAAPAVLRQAVARFRADAAAFLSQGSAGPLYGYGAAAKTVTLLAASGFNWPFVAIADAAPSKAGRFLPVGGIPIVQPDRLAKVPPARLFLFAWNLADEIVPRFPGWEIWSPVPKLRRLA